MTLSVPYLGSNCLEHRDGNVTVELSFDFQYPTSGRTAWRVSGQAAMAKSQPFSTLPRVELPGALPPHGIGRIAALAFSTLPRVELPGAALKIPA